MTISISCYELRTREPRVSLTIAGNGPGLSLEQKQKVFDAFFTTKTSGTGLGMAIARRVVDADGGTINVGGETFRGAEFVITLPLADGSQRGTPE